MKNIEDGVGSKRYTFSKIAKAPGYPLLDFYINAGPFDFQEPKNFEIIENPNDISQRTHPHLFDTFTVRGGSIYFNQLKFHFLIIFFQKDFMQTKWVSGKQLLWFH